MRWLNYTPEEKGGEEEGEKHQSDNNFSFFSLFFSRERKHLFWGSLNTSVIPVDRGEWEWKKEQMSLRWRDFCTTFDGLLFFLLLALFLSFLLPLFSASFPRVLTDHWARWKDAEAKRKYSGSSLLPLGGNINLGKPNFRFLLDGWSK